MANSELSALVTPSFHLRSWPFCPLAQRVMVALAARDTPWTHDSEGQDGEPPRLTVRRSGRSMRIESESLRMLAAVDASLPGPQLLPRNTERRQAVQTLAQLGVNIQERLSVVTRATDPVDYDLAVYRLTLRLDLAEAIAPAVGGSPVPWLDLAHVVFGPTLWRLGVLDRHCETFLLSGHPRLAAWERALSAHPAVQAVFPPEAETRYLGTLLRRGAVMLSAEDASTWRLLLGHENGLSGAG